MGCLLSVEWYNIEVCAWRKPQGGIHWRRWAGCQIFVGKVLLLSYNDGGRRVSIVDKSNANEQGKKCFIITPIGNETSDTFRKAKGVIESVIKPVLKANGFDDIKPAYEINVSGMINTQIINRIIEDDLVIVNLTGNNPNVMYELCLRHVVAKPIIHICENGTILPFDIKDNRTIFYENDMLGVEELKEKIILFLTEISYEREYVDNPIYTARRQEKLLKETQGTETNEIIKWLVDISSKIAELIVKNEKTEKHNNANATRTYSIEQYERDIRSIKKEKIHELLYRKQSMEVYELARQLNVPSAAIIIASKITEVNVDSMVRLLSFDEIKKILQYILIEHGDD